MPERSALGTSIEIDAPIDRVWQVMTDFARYPSWNPFVHRVDCEAEVSVGSDLFLHVTFADGAEATAAEEVTVWQPPAEGRAELTYAFRGPMHTLRLVRGVRTQALTELPGGRTRYETVERFSGLLRPLLPLDKIAVGLRSQACALARAARELPGVDG